MNNLIKKIISPRNLGTAIAILVLGGAAAYAAVPAYKSWLQQGTNLYTAPGTNVGIGTASPTAKLDVIGDVTWSGALLGGIVPWARITGFTGDLTPDTIADDGTITLGTETSGNYLSSLNGVSGNVSIAGGGSASVSVSGNTITVSTPTCTPLNVPIACSGSGSCSATCPAGYVITSWNCSMFGIPTISVTTGTCSISGGQFVTGSGFCQAVC